METCKNCKYFDEKICRRYPTQPRRSPDEWCGEIDTKVEDKKEKPKE